MSGPEPVYSSGIVSFDSLDALRLYMRQLLGTYERLADMYGEKIGTLMRVREELERNGRRTPKLNSQSWRKVGFFYVNDRDALLGTLEILLEAMEEYKVKIIRTSEVLKKFEELEGLSIPVGSKLTLYVRNGVPFRMVVDSQKTILVTEVPRSVGA